MKDHILRKGVRGTFWLFFGVIAMFFTVECMLFFLNMADDTPPERADVIITFAGSVPRVKAGYGLAGQGLGNALIVSSTSKKQCSKNAAKYHLPSHVKQIVENKARTTFEDALYTSLLIKNNGFTSAILVTSFHHIPRSSLLLRLLLIGNPVTIQTHAVPVEGLNSSNWAQTTMGIKLMYNEMIQFWGSIGEFVYYKMTGHVPARAWSQRPIVKRLKSVLLFDLDT